MGLSIILILYVHTSLAPALTQMVEYFDSDYATVSWVFTAYLISGAAVTIVIGRLADIYGAKKMLLLVFLCYIIGTVLGGFAQNIYTLLVFRTIQGVAVAVVPICGTNRKRICFQRRNSLTLKEFYYQCIKEEAQ